jgi:long-chain acyl-CoA synthetase
MQTATAATEPTTKPRAVATPVDGKGIPDAYLRRLALDPEKALFLTKRDGQWKKTTWAEGHARVLALFAGLKRAGVGAGDRVCILSQSSPEWFLCDHAILGLGGVTVPIYQSSHPDDVRFIVEHSGAKLVFAEDAAQCAKLGEALAGMATPPKVVCLHGAGPGATPLDAFATPLVGAERAATEEAFRKSAIAVGPDQLASIVYTSGTTGRPKGAALRHRHLAAELRGAIQCVGMRSHDTSLSFLPFAHILGRVESMAPIFAGITLAFAENMNAIAANIAEVRPSILVSVPRIYEKINAKIVSEVESGSPVKRAIFQWAVTTGREVARRRAFGDAVSPLLLAKFQVADRLVLSKVREKLGGNLRFTISGGAPLSKELCEFFYACGIQILEGYGLTETSAAAFANQPSRYMFGTVGLPFEGVEVKIASDGEILLKGPMVFDGYYNDAEATAEAFVDGWFKTGDIGEIDSRGFLRITDRKKELIVTSGGKNIAPQKLENLLKQRRFISNAMVYGDKRKYLVALVTLNEPDIKSWAKQQGIAFGSYAELVEKPEVHKAIQEQFAAVNAELASFETIKKFKILPEDFTVENGFITPSLKLKRKVITKHHQPLIDAMYGGAEPA